MMKTALSVENLSKVYLRDKKKTSNVNALNNITNGFINPLIFLIIMFISVLSCLFN